MVGRGWGGGERKFNSTLRKLCVCGGGGGRGGGTRRNISSSVVALRACLNQTDIMKPWRRTCDRCPPNVKLSSCCQCSLFALCLCSLFTLCLCSLFPLCLCSLFPLWTVCFSLCSLFPLCLYSLFPLCAVCFLFVQSFSSLYSLFRFVCAICFVLSVQSVSFSATMAMRNKQRPHLHTVCGTACNAFQNFFRFSHSDSETKGAAGF